MKTTIQKLSSALAIVLVFFSAAKAQELQGIINSYAAVTAIDTCTGALEVNDTAGFEVGMSVILIQMQGATINTSNSSIFGRVEAMNGAGWYEKNVIAAIDGSTITLGNFIQHPYNTTDGAVQLISMPTFENASVSDTLKPMPWNGSTGGVLALQVDNELTVNGIIDASGTGFRGGEVNETLDNNCNFFTFFNAYYYDIRAWWAAGKGEGIAPYISELEAGRGPQANGGGGGNDHNTGGGGGANVTAGGPGGSNQNAPCRGNAPGLGGRAIATSTERLFMGGGGGAGHNNNNYLTRGGNGGGIIIIEANTITGTGQIITNGTAGIDAISDGAGGGGAGGTILVQANTIENIQFTATGGNGGSVDNGFNDRCMGPGGGGSGGRILSNLAIPNSSVIGGTVGETFNSSGCDGSSNGATNGEAGIIENLDDLLETSDEYSNINAPFSLSCMNSTANTIIFEWSQSAAESYQYGYAVNGQLILENQTTTDQQLSLDNLTPGDEATLFLQAISPSACALVDTSFTCSTVVCTPPTTSVFENTAREYCYTGDAIQLAVDDRNGTFSGIGVDSTGRILPDEATQAPFFAYYSYQDDSGCTWTDSLEILVAPPLPAPTVDCGTRTDQAVTINWTHPTATAFELRISINNSATIDTVQVDAFSFTQNNLQAGDQVEFQVIALSDGICGNSPATATICQTERCPDVDIDFTNVQPFYCTNDSASIIEATPSGGTFSGIGLEADGTFDPSQINVPEDATEERIALTYLLPPPPDCPIPSETIFVQILPALDTPVISCIASSPSSLTFQIDHPSTTNFDITYQVNGGTLAPSIRLTTDTFTIENLQANQRVEFFATAVAVNACGDSPAATVVCQTDDCPERTITITGLEEEYCYQDLPTVLTATPAGGQFLGAADPLGNFDPLIADSGRNVVIYEYTDTNGCHYQDSAITNVVGPFTPQFTNLGDAYCQNEAPTQITATPVGGIFSGEGITPDGLFDPGTMTTNRTEITYTYERAGCTYSTTKNVVIESLVPAPSISCGMSSTNSVQFRWNRNTFSRFRLDISVNGTSMVSDSVTTDDFYVQSDLDPGDEVEITLVALLDNSCASQSLPTTFTCLAETCPGPINIEFEPVPSICLSAESDPIDLEANVEGISDLYVERWEGPGIVDSIMGIFDPSTLQEQTGDLILSYTASIANCQYQENFTLRVFENPVIDAGMPQELTCANRQLQLNGQVANSENADISRWTTTEGNIVVGGNSSTPFVDAPGWYTFEVQNEACTARDSVQISSNTESPEADPGTDQRITCKNNAVLLGGMEGSVGPEFTYTWEGPMSFSSNLRQPTVSNAGVYSLVVTDIMNGCTSDTASVTVEDTRQIPEAVILSEGDLNCERDSIHLDASNSTQGPDITYEWTDADGLFLTPTSEQLLTVGQPGTYTLVLLDTLTGCGNSTTISVEEDFEMPIAEAGAVIETPCARDAVQLDGTASSTGIDFQYHWIGENIQSGSNTLEPIVGNEGFFILHVLNTQNGCTASDSTQVIFGENTIANISVEANSAYCKTEEGGTITVSEVMGGAPPYLYSLNGEAFTQRHTFNNLSPGTYQLQIQESNGCEYDTTLQIEAPGTFEIDLGSDWIIQLGDSLVLEPEFSSRQAAFAERQWYVNGQAGCSNCPVLEISPFHTTTYRLEVEDENGCQASASITVHVKKDNLLYIPNVFSPNGDGQNDIFTFFPTAAVKSIRNFQIFDRWGTLVFAQAELLPTPVKKGWDGTFAGELLPPGVYVFTAQVTYIDDREENLSGEVTLLR